MFTAVALAVTVPVILVFIWLQYRSLAQARYAGLAGPSIVASQSVPTTAFPPPRLQNISGEQLRQFRTKEESELNNYGWADAAHQFVRIPIGRAMELVAARGLPVRGTNVNSLGPSELELVKQRSQDRQLAPIKEAK